MKFGPRGWVFSVYRVLVKLNATGHSVYFWFQQPSISKTLGLRAKHTPKSLCDCYSVLCGHSLPSCQAGLQIPRASCYLLRKDPFFNFSRFFFLLTWGPIGAKIWKRYSFQIFEFFGTKNFGFGGAWQHECAIFIYLCFFFCFFFLKFHVHRCYL